MAINSEGDAFVNSVEPAGESRFTVMFRSLHSRNFRLFFGGQGLSLIGTWMTNVAMSWLVYRLTGSALLLGLVGFASQVPAVISPFAGVLVDRWDRHRLLVVTQSLAMVQSFALAALTLTHVIRMPHIVLLALFQGLINAFDIPGRQAFLSQMIERKEDLSNAIALNSSMFNGARLIGPSIAGIIIAASNEGVCFLIDGISYVAVIAALLAMRVPPRQNGVPNRPVLHEFREGIRYIIRFTPILYILLLMAGISLVGVPYIVLLPVISGDVLHGDAHTFGFLTGAAGMGALAGALYLAGRRTVVGLGRHIVWATGAFGLSLVLVGLSRSFWLTLALLAVTGFSMMVEMAACNTVVQTIVDEDKRGRVMSFFTLAFMGTVPFGSLLAGAAARGLGAPRTLMAGGALCVLVAIWFSRELPAIRKIVRPVYVRLGILPEIASGLGAGSNAGMPREE